MIPPKENAALVTTMENILETYRIPYDKDFPVVCMDEQPIQFLGDVWKPIRETKNHPKRVDYKCNHKGTASIL